MSVSVVIPVYNSRATLPELLERIREVLGRRGEPFEIILVNDGSHDGSWSVIEELAGRWSEVRGLDMWRNFGQHNALLCGIRDARYPITVTLDDDLQHPPEEIPRLLGELASGNVDVVYGVPEARQHPWFRNWSSGMVRLIMHLLVGRNVARWVSAFRAFRTDLREGFAGFHSPFVAIDVLLTWSTTRFAAVEVRHEPRRVGRSQYTLRRLIRFALDMLTGFSTLPLRLASLMGFSITLLGLMILMGVLVRYCVQGCPVAGFTFLASIIAVFSGTQLFALGIIGEYLGRIFSRSMGRPSYLLRRSTAHDYSNARRVA